MNSTTFFEMAAYLKKQGEQLAALERLSIGSKEAAAVVAPFGVDLSGNPKTAPAYDACRPMWEAAQRDGVFNVHDFIGPGIQQFAAQITSPTAVDQQALEDAIVALGMSDWGKAWLAHDVNAELINPAYLKRFVGYTVMRVYDGRGDLIRFDHVQ